MPYSALSDLKNQISEDQLIELTDDHALGVVDQQKVDQAIADADAEIDAYLAERYTVPLSPVPVLIKLISVDLAIYHLYSRRMGAPEDREKRYKAKVKLLDKLSSGQTTLGMASPPPVEAGGSFSADARNFTRKKMEGF